MTHTRTLTGLSKSYAFEQGGFTRNQEAEDSREREETATTGGWDIARLEGLGIFLPVEELPVQAGQGSGRLCA